MRVEGIYLKRTYELGSLVLVPSTPLIGAEVQGLDLRTELAPETRESLEEALRRHKVLFFRGQELSSSELVAFGRRLGPLLSYGLTGGDIHPGHPELKVFEYDETRRGREAFWHFDVLPDRRPAKASILRARLVPEVGGDTLFCDLEAVYRSLPEADKTRLGETAGIYDFVFNRQLARFRGKSEAEVMAISPEIPLEEFPLVLTDPADGRKVLFVNPSFLIGIQGMTSEESRAVLDDLRTRINQPEFQCRHRWQPGDVAYWDNRSCLHYATNNYWPERRIMERLSLVGVS
jgi:taurine dioxygenase